MDLEEILAVVDPTCDEQPVIERGAWLAEKSGAELELFVCDYDQALSGDRFFDSQRLAASRASFIEHRRERLEQQAQRPRERGVVVATDAQWDAPLYEGIVRKVRRARPDLVLKDTHHHSLLHRSLLSNTDWQLIRTCPAPLWLVKPQAPRVERVLAAVDPGHLGDQPADLDRRILDTAAGLAATLGAELHVVHVYQPLSPAVPIIAAAAVPLATETSGEDYRRTLARMHEERVESLVAERSIPAGCVHVVEGGISEVLLRTAGELGIGLVVMGAVSRSRLYDAFIGGTAERVLEALPCDVLIVKPRGFHTPVGERGRDQ